MGFIDDKRAVSLTEKPIKPRRVKGTAAARARNKFASVVVAGGVLIGFVYMFLPTTERTREFMKDLFIQLPPIDQRVRQMTFVGEKKSSVDIEKLLAELGRPVSTDSEASPKQ